MPRANAGNPTNPRKRAANPPPPTTANEHQQQVQQWQPDLPCKFHQLPNTLIMEILSWLPFNTLFDCRVQGARKCDKPYAEGSSGCAGSGMPPHKSAKLDSGHDLPTLEEGLPRATSSAVSPEFSWRIGTACILYAAVTWAIFSEARDSQHVNNALTLVPRENYSVMKSAVGGSES